MTKLEQLAELEGMEELEMLEAATWDNVAAGICTTPGCDYTTPVEPDCDGGWCELCDKGTVSSCLVLAGLI